MNHLDETTVSFQTEEQRRAAFDEAGVIDSSILKTPTETDFEPSIEFPTDSIADLSIETLSPVEIQEQKVREDLARTQEKQAGEAEFRAEREEAAGIAELTKTRADLAGRLALIQAEEKAIPLQLQEEARGRGITKGGLRPIQAGRLRANAIRALTVSSLLEASKGNLTTALDLIDRAVAQKFDPIREDIRIKKNNLDLILDSPEFSKAEKDRAKAEKAKQEKAEKELDIRETREKEIQTVAVNAAKNGADALTLQLIQNASSQAEALRISAEAGFAAKAEKVTVEKQDRPMSLTDIKNFTEIYGWRPPSGVSQNEALQFMKDNPGATPAELQKDAEEAVGIVQAPERTVEEVTTFIEENMTEAQLKVFKTKAKEAGFTRGGSFFFGLGVGVEGVSDYLASIKSKIQIAISQGFSEQEILDFLASN